MNRLPLHPFHPVIADWFARTFGQPTDVQVRAWGAIGAGQHTLIAAPTGSGKTLAAMLPCLDAVVRGKLAQRHPAAKAEQTDGRRGVRVLYLSPLKALNNDVHHNLVTFIEAIDRQAAEQDADWPGIRCAVRTGDTPASQRTAMAKRPPDVLLTTPESLYILLTSENGRSMLRTVRHVVVDEIHDLASDKRGAHLSLSLERLAQLCGRPIQRIGVSATQKPMWRVARFLGGWEPAAAKGAGSNGCGQIGAAEMPGSVAERTFIDGDRNNVGAADDAYTVPDDADDAEKAEHPLGYVPRPVAIIESAMSKAMQVSVTMPDQSKPITTREAIWQPMLQRLFALMEGCRTVLIFVNSRRLCERVCLRLNDAAGYEMSRAHHGSLAKERRLEAERLLKSGELRCIVATSSLELGIDVGHVDLVIQIDPPFGAASGIQRIGRAGHSVGDTSRGAIVIRHRGALAEAAVLSKLIAERDIEPIRIVRHPLDVLSQHAVSMASSEDWPVTELFRLIVRSDSYRLFPYERLLSMLRVLSGFYPFARPLIDWNRDTDMLSGRKSGAIAALTGAGTIPSSSAYPVHHMDSRVHLGELDEEYVHESRVGDVFQLGSNNWMIRRIDKDRVYVTEAVNSFSEIPFWRNEAGGRSAALGMRIGALLRELADRLNLHAETEAAGGHHEDMLGAGEAKNEWMARSAVEGQAAATGAASDSERQDDRRHESDAPAEPAGINRLADQQTVDWLVECYGMDDYSADSLISYVRSQHSFCGLPTDRRIIVEHYKDVSNQTHIIIHNWFGRRLNRTWLLAIERQFEQLLPYRLYGNAKDNGIEFVLPEWDPSWLQSAWLVTPGNLEPLLTEAITGSPLLAIAFRHLAETSLLLSRSFTRTPLWQKRLRSEELLREAMPYAQQFPYLEEAMRECLHRFLDMDGLRGVLESIGDGRFEFVVRETQYPSPMATQFIAEYVNMRIYEGDGIDDVVRMQLLNVSKELAGKVFGDDAVRGLVSAEVLESERQRLSDREARLAGPDDLLSLLKLRGDLGTDELVRFGGEAVLPWLDELSSRGAAVQADLGPPGGDGPIRWVCRDEQETYGLFPEDPTAVSFIIGRYSEHELSFTEPALCERYPALSLPAAREAVDTLRTQGKIEQAPFASDPDERLWTGRRTAERIIRLSIGEARKRAEPAAPTRWFVQMAMRQHALGGTQLRGEDGLRAVIGKLQGMYLPLSHWETILFPSRLLDYRPEQLDLLCASGEVIWLGRKADGEKEGRIAFFLAESKPLYEPYVSGVAASESDAVHVSLLNRLRSGGASFLTKLARDEATSPSDTMDALLELVWAGQASNDQFAPLRLHAGKKKSDWARTGSGQGRWYWTGGLADAAYAPAEARLPAAKEMPIDYGGTSEGDPPNKAASSVRAGYSASDLRNADSSAMHWVRHLLDSYGIVTKELVSALSPYSWDQLLTVLKQLEEWGAVTRGRFVDGEATMQFTSPDNAETVRAPIPQSADIAVTVLSAVDPANPYGLIADWPKTLNCAFARKAGHYLVLRGDQWLYWIENNGRRIHAIEAPSQHTDADADAKVETELAANMSGSRSVAEAGTAGHRTDPETVAKDASSAAKPVSELRTALAAIMRRQRLTKIVIELWNGEPVLAVEPSKQLLAIGAERDGQRIVLWPSVLR